MACRNASAFVIQSLESFVNQDHIPLEMIVIDDNSEDDSAIKVQKFIDNTRVDNIRLIRLDQQRGCAGARNAGIGIAKGKYIAVWDADDFYEKDRISATVKYMEKNSLDACGSWAKTVDDNSNIIEEYDYPPSDNDTIIWMLPSKKNPMIDPSCIIKKQSLVISGCWSTDAKISLAPDLDLWFRMASKGMRLGNMQRFLTFYRIQPNSNTISKNKEMISHHVEVVRKHYGKVELNRHEQYAKNQRMVY